MIFIPNPRPRESELGHVKMKKSVIYKITSPSGRYYVGKTIDFRTRMATYKNLKGVGQNIIHASIIKYGWENHIVEILEEAPPEKLNELEIKYIKELNSFSRDNPMGLNLTRGGDGALGRKDSEETKKKRAEKHIGSKRSEETKKLMSEKKKGKIPLASTLPRTEKQLYHAKYGNLGRKKSAEESEKELNTKLKKFLDQFGGILQIDLSGNVVKEWRMLPMHVAREKNICCKYLYKALKSDRLKIVKGYHWRYKN